MTEENTMGQLARMYKILEDHLRRKEMSMHALRMQDDVHKTERNNWQVRDILRTFDRHNCLIKSGTGRGMTYKWNPEAPPFTLTTSMQRVADTKPGPVAITKPHTAPKQMEIEFAGVILTLGVNPDTGLFRIIVDQKGN